jgi:hypothetical protein
MLSITRWGLGVEEGGGGHNICMILRGMLLTFLSLEKGGYNFKKYRSFTSLTPPTKIIYAPLYTN